jgi:hypothetical protein
MTAEQRHTLRQLARCTMLPGSWDKRFVRDLIGYSDDQVLSPRQAAMVEKLSHRYRRQISRLAPGGQPQ